MSSSALKITISPARRSHGSLLAGQANLEQPILLSNLYAKGRDGSREEVIVHHRRWLYAQVQIPNSPSEF